MAARANAPERIREFAILADQILANSAVIDGVEWQMRFEATDRATGAGTVKFSGPNDHLMRSLLLDLRNVIQKGDLELGEVLRDLREAIQDPKAHAIIDAIATRFVEHGAVGMTSQNGKPFKPAEIVRLWMYAIYHHRDLSKLRRIRALEPMMQLVHRQEFHVYVANVCNEVENVRRLIDEVKRLGFLAGIDVPPFSPPRPRKWSADRLAMRAFIAHIARQGGSVTYRWSDIESALEPFGGGVHARIRVAANVESRRLETVTFTVVKAPEEDSS